MRNKCRRGGSRETGEMCLHEAACCSWGGISISLRAGEYLTKHSLPLVSSGCLAPGMCETRQPHLPHINLLEDVLGEPERKTMHRNLCQVSCS